MQDKTGANQAICRAMDDENTLTVTHIMNNYLSAKGPMTLGVVTNRLRSSIRPSLSVISGATISSAIGSNVVYAAPHEFGFDGNVSVKSFTRANPHGDRFSLGTTGKTVSRFTALRAGLLSKTAAGKKAVASGKYTFSTHGGKLVSSAAPVTVKAHSRHMKIKARHYVFNGIKSRLESYGTAISEAITTAWKGGRES